ncbi:hypothetical protein DFH27DRAFT_30298 [Peziza echinospora]|nr:hypothetical protein DFH27DRAFT_30298 [Peziza echinospora]
MGPTPIVLVPQPSDDPNNPLNWPFWKHDVILVVLCLVSIIAAALGPIHVVDVRSHFRTNKTSQGLALGRACYLCHPQEWGKRHLYLLGTILLIVSAIWGALSTTYRSFLWARILQGVAVSPFEALVNIRKGRLVAFVAVATIAPIGVLYRCSDNRPRVSRCSAITLRPCRCSAKSTFADAGMSTL